MKPEYSYKIDIFLKDNTHLPNGIGQLVDYKRGTINSSEFEDKSQIEFFVEMLADKLDDYDNDKFIGKVNYIL